MSSRRTVILIAAIVLGALAAFATLRYVSGVEDRANEDAQRVEILIATDSIPEGTSATEAEAAGLITRAEIPKSNVPVDAVEAIDTLGDKVAVTTIATRTPITESLFISRDAALVTNRERIPKGMVAITISVDQVRGVAGLITPGDTINIMARGEPPSGADEIPTVEAITRSTPAYTVFQGVRVLFVGDRAAVTPSQQSATDEETPEGEAPPDENTLATVGSNLLTLAVPQEAAEIIASIGDGAFYLTLQGSDTTTEPVDPGPPTFSADTPSGVPLPATDPDALTPYGPDGLIEEG